MNAEAAKSTCKTMFKKYKVDTNSVRIDCSKRSGAVTVCQATCVNEDDRFVNGSPESIVCKSKKASPGGAKIKKASFKCAPKTALKSSTVMQACGDITQAKFGIKLGEGVIANCNGKACFPKCADPAASPSVHKFSCIKKRGKMNVLPQKLTVTCNTERTVLNGCGDINLASNKKVINNLDPSVKITCLERYCKLDCVNPDHIFAGANARWANTLIRCNGKSYVPKKLQAKCSPTQAPTVTAATTTKPATQAVESADKVVGGNPSAGFKCGNILNALEVHPDISFNCAKAGKVGKCTASCAVGKPSFTWPDGKVVEKSVFLCKGNKWLPPKGRIVCA